MGCSLAIQKENTTMQKNSINNKEYFKHYITDGSINVTKNNRIIKHESCDQQYGELYSDRTIYGKYIIHKYDEGIYTWKIKIHSMKTPSSLNISCIIGIDEAKYKSKNTLVAYNETTDHYGFSSEGERYGRYGYQSSETDFKFGTTNPSRYAIVRLSLDFTCNPPKLTLSNHNNTKSIGWELKDFNYSTIGYCLAIYSRAVGDEFEILSFQKQSNEEKLTNYK